MPLKIEGYFCFYSLHKPNNNMKYTNLIDAKTHLNIESVFTEDDIYITSLLNVAEIAVSNYCNDVTFEDFTALTAPVTIVQAVYFLVANWYVNRQIVSFAQGVEIPYTFQFLLNPYKNYVVQ